MWNIQIATAAATPVYFLTPAAAIARFEQLAADHPEVASLFHENWFPWQEVQQLSKQPWQVESIEAKTHRLYALLLRSLAEAGIQTNDLPAQLDLAPGALMKKWHGKAVAQQYLLDLRAAGWDVATQPWPPES